MALVLLVILPCYASCTWSTVGEGGALLQGHLADSIAQYGPPPLLGGDGFSGSACYNCGAWCCPPAPSCPLCTSRGRLQLPGLSAQVLSWCVSFRALALRTGQHAGS
jgi:hypothetical protein